MRKALNKVLVIGSRPIVIGQAAEFDYAGTQACLALKEEGIEVILVNNNPATMMTDKHIADRVYMEPLTVESVEAIIAREQPDGLIGTLGGQTGLNLTIALYKRGILEKHQVKVLGSSVDSIQKGENREQFRQLMHDINEPVCQSKIVKTIDAGLSFAKQIGFPVILRPAYTLGGEGGGFADNAAELLEQLPSALELSPIHQVLVEKSIKGWKEIEYEVMRDENDTCIIICNMENMDPVGVHTGDSMVTAPSQTLSDTQYQMLRSASLKVIRALKVVGACNIQFALDPNSNHYYIIEVNPRVSRSSALASKATGYPIARIATKCAIGYHLDEIANPITGNTYASFEPALDYITVKLPRFAFDKFTEADRTLGTQMKATGEVMAIDRTFEGALQKAIRSLEMDVDSLHLSRIKKKSDAELQCLIQEPNDLWLFAIAEAMMRGKSIKDLHAITQIDIWFLTKIERILALENELKKHSILRISKSLLLQAKRFNLSDRHLAKLMNTKPELVRKRLNDLQIKPAYKLVDTCAGEFNAITPYYYSTWHGRDEVKVGNNCKKIVILGSGPIRIGQGVEFDYCSVHAVLAVKKLGYEAIVINNNPETVSTDYSVADKLYFEPLEFEDVLRVIEKEKVDGVLVQFGGQTAINLANELEEAGVPILGTAPKHIDQMEDREQFYQLLDEWSILHMKGSIVQNEQQLTESTKELGFPVLIRPSYVIGGQSMFICYNHAELEQYINRIKEDTNDRCWPLLIDPYLPGKECEVDVISDGKDIIIPGIVEHVERAGVHSGDSLAVFPPMSLLPSEKQQITAITRKIAQMVPIIGMMNIQFILHAGKVYVLEVNPRSSRTVPILSKVTDTPMVEWAVQVQLRKRLTDLADQLGLCREPPFITVKSPVFSAAKLKGVDHLLGPEMKSTGEIIAISKNKQQAFSKLFPLYVNQFLDKQAPTIFVSIADRMKTHSLKTIQACIQAGASLLATEGTAVYLQEHGLPVTVIKKQRNELEKLRNGKKPDLILNLPNQGREPNKFGFYLREWATRHQIPCFTSLETFEWLVLQNRNQVSPKTKVVALQDYHAACRKEKPTSSRIK
ncbi:MAG: carbamoyl phosphate synthase large subunit [Virgibacillus proomii]|jgi:carbamoyl-phosphate synthase large subunit